MSDPFHSIRARDRAQRREKRGAAWSGAWSAFQAEAVSDSPSLNAEDIDRRAKQIMENNPGHARDVAIRAAQEEAEAVRTLETSSEADRLGAAYHLRARQLQAAYLALSYGEALEMARKQFESP